jgi:hypothetical protein
MGFPCVLNSILLSEGPENSSPENVQAFRMEEC